jgi:hypothetical protein
MRTIHVPNGGLMPKDSLNPPLIGTKKLHIVRRLERKEKHTFAALAA